MAEETYKSWSISQVANWLRNSRMPENIVNLFVKQEIDGQALETLTMKELKKEIGVKTLGRQKAIMRALDNLRGNPLPIYIYIYIRNDSCHLTPNYLHFTL